MGERIVLQRSILNVLGLACLRENITTMHYNTIFHAFKRLASIEPDYFPGLHFISAGSEPHSNKLEDIISSLGTWQVLSVENPRYEYLKINKTAVQSLVDEIKRSYGEKILAQYSALAKEFAAQVSLLEMSNA